MMQGKGLDYLDTVEVADSNSARPTIVFNNLQPIHASSKNCRLCSSEQIKPSFLRYRFHCWLDYLSCGITKNLILPFAHGLILPHAIF